MDVRDVSVRTAESDAADLKDFLRRAGISDVASVTIRDVDRYATRLGLDNLDRDTRRRRLYTLSPSTTGCTPEDTFRPHPMSDFRIPRRRTSEKSSIFTEAEVQKLIYGFKPPTPSRQPWEPRHVFEQRVPHQALRERRDIGLLAVVYGCALRADEPSDDATPRPKGRGPPGCLSTRPQSVWNRPTFPGPLPVAVFREVKERAWYPSEQAPPDSGPAGPTGRDRPRAPPLLPLAARELRNPPRSSRDAPRPTPNLYVPPEREHDYGLHPHGFPPGDRASPDRLATLESAPAPRRAAGGAAEAESDD